MGKGETAGQPAPLMEYQPNHGVEITTEAILYSLKRLSELPGMKAWDEMLKKDASVYFEREAE